MKNLKKISIGLLLLCTTTMPAFAATLVNAGDFATLQNAVNSYESTVDDIVINLTMDFNITQTLTIPANGNGKTLTITGNSANRTLTRGMGGNLFTVSANAVLVLKDIIIDGDKNGSFSSGGGSLLIVNSAGMLIMDAGAVVRNNYYHSGSGVYVDGGTFTLNGGRINENTAYADGGGVYVLNGTFTMEDGEISGNTANDGNSSGNGGGVSILGTGKFEINGGKISGNTARNNGGGVYAPPLAIFIMTGGEISGNIILFSSFMTGGGGVYAGSTFIMEGGEISGNTAIMYGGGVLVDNGTFTMSGGKISGNNTSASAFTHYAGGGGVYVFYGTFTMEGGEISGNTAGSNNNGNGGGVSIAGNDAKFEMSGGKINGNDAGDGGGVRVQGTFIMSGGEISENEASYGGGVYVDGTFTLKNGGKISGNEAKDGGGVYVKNGFIFTMIGGEINKNNTVGAPYDSYGDGGGVFVGGTFIMEGGEISENTTGNGRNGGGAYINNVGALILSGGKISENKASSGVGVCVNGGTLAMTGGEISRNTTSADFSYGGGVFINNGGAFTMSSGKISWNTARGNAGGVYVGFNSTFIINGGLVFGKGRYIYDIVDGGSYSFNSSAFPAANNGIIIAFNAPADAEYISARSAESFDYIKGTSDDLLFNPAEATIVWAIQDSRSGISYKNGNNEGFIEITGITVTEPTAVAETFDKQPLFLYPNPTKGQLQVKNYELQADNTTYGIFNAMGQLILQEKLQSMINVETLVRGVYYLQIGEQILKFVKE